MGKRFSIGDEVAFSYRGRKIQGNIEILSPRAGVMFIRAGMHASYAAMKVGGQWHVYVGNYTYRGRVRGIKKS